MKLIFILFFFLSILSNSHAYLRCPDGTNITKQMLFDGNNDCIAGQDEDPGGLLGCGTSHTRLANQYVCDGQKDCDDGSDEEECASANNSHQNVTINATGNNPQQQQQPQSQPNVQGCNCNSQSQQPFNGQANINVNTTSNPQSQQQSTVRPNRAFSAPAVFKVVNSTKDLKHLPVYMLRGKIPDNAEKCTITLLIGKNSDETVTQNDLLSEFSSVESPMRMFVDFTKNEIVINTIVKKKLGNLRLYIIAQSENAIKPMEFIKGADFVMRIEPFVSMMRFDVLVNSNNITYEADFAEEEEFNAITSMAVPNFVLGDIVLYEEPKFVLRNG